QEVSTLKNWRIHGAYFNQANISRYFRWQTWTVKPAFQAHEYGPEIETGRHLNPALPMTVTN
ncbi:MAG: hypothetical protein LC725_04735, partial [Lentisphaerae bacterium]|nr:hypothetical protein [Lentisphaerota bacterium]